MFLVTPKGGRCVALHDRFWFKSMKKEWTIKRGIRRTGVLKLEETLLFVT
jgi:hypothetical protein